MDLSRIQRLGRALTATLTLGVTGTVAATGLQVAPISLQLQARQNADGLWLSNTGASVLNAQVRVYHWTQEDGEERLVPSRNLLASPPMLAIGPADRQLVRVIRIGPPPMGAAATEDAYRVIIDELPVTASGKQGVQFVLRYSVPVFIEPEGKSRTAPHLNWSLQREGDRAVLNVSNAGNGHAQLSQITFVDRHGKKTDVNAGLLGYVLPGAHKRWTLKTPAAVFAAGGTLNAKVNDEVVAQPVSLDAAAR
ncbi:fimbrial biogenesis chaperone [Rhodanobacter spathiphylli]|jgi:fimbrial chaperone protein|uniref:P pilus assembly protein chaperone PapD-like protein n=1 Tax=Rhodanobacter spathiphylli B39 TaxID=1163407 RepID=I4W2Y1_9GAMM|nr:molecular chaperone [Rhodanobacter spathiphylli]EIL93822.1 P pilus assembly protein chaperone PapD-like protein [Rhodanobacter spathiphylli B39]